MGGLHAAMVGSLNPFAVGVVAWMAPPSAIPAFIDGLLASSCDWKTLSSDEKYQLVQEMVEISNMKNGCVQELLSKFLDITNIREEKYYQTPIDPSLATIMLAQHDEYIGSVRHEWEVWLKVHQHLLFKLRPCVQGGKVLQLNHYLWVMSAVFYLKTRPTATLLKRLCNPYRIVFAISAKRFIHACSILLYFRMH